MQNMVEGMILTLTELHVYKLWLRQQFYIAMSEFKQIQDPKCSLILRGYLRGRTMHMYRLDLIFFIVMLV